MLLSKALISPDPVQWHKRFIFYTTITQNTCLSLSIYVKSSGIFLFSVCHKPAFLTTGSRDAKFSRKVQPITGKIYNAFQLTTQSSKQGQKTGPGALLFDRFGEKTRQKSLLTLADLAGEPA